MSAPWRWGTGLALLGGLLAAGEAVAVPPEAGDAPAAGEETAPPAEDAAAAEDGAAEDGAAEDRTQMPRAIVRGTERALEVGPPAGFAWAGHGLLALAPLGELAFAARADGGGAWRPVATAAGGALLGLVPARLGYVYSDPTEPRWREVDVAVLGLSLVLTPPLAALGSWGTQELLLGGSVHPGRAYLGALAGAAVGHLAGLALNGLLVRLFPDPEPDLGGFRLGIALGLIGASATLGQQWLGGGPRPR